MDLRDLGRVGLKLFGVWTALESIGWLLGIFQLYTNRPDRPPGWLILGYLLPALVYALVTWLLLARTEKLLVWLIAEKKFASLGSPSERFQAIVFSGLGVYLVVQSIPTLVDGLVITRLVPTLQNIDDGRLGYRPLMYSLLRLGIGLCLFLGAEGLARLWHRMRAVPNDSMEPPR
jgi:hypothetical protein